MDHKTQVMQSSMMTRSGNHWDSFETWQISSHGEMIVKGFRIILVALLFWSPVSCQSSFFYKRIPVIHLGDDIVDVYELTGMDGHRQHQGRHSSNNPEVSRIISMLLSPADTDESFDHHPVNRRQQSFSRRRSFTRVTQRWPEGVIPFVIHGSLRKYNFSSFEKESCSEFIQFLPENF